MNNKRNEQRMMWLMTLMIVGIGAWFLDFKPIGYVCLIACMMSVMHYADGIEKPIQQYAEQQHQEFSPSSKVPLYIAATLSLVGMLFSFAILAGIGLSIWIFLFLSWLQRLERSLFYLKHIQQNGLPNIVQQEHVDTALIHRDIQVPAKASQSLSDQVHTWIFQGNPVLKAAILILVIGVILLLRFATEHWQFSLGFKLAILSGVCMTVIAAGYLLTQRNQAVGLGIQGLGLASLFITLFFAYDQTVISSLGMASCVFIVIQILNIGLSLKQRSLALAVMAMVAAYLAPLTVPQLELTTAALLVYYLAVNLAVMIISSVQPWKILNQIAFLTTLMIGTVYASFHGITDQKVSLSWIIVLHSLLFAGIGLRFSYLMAKEEPESFHVHPIVDLMLIYAVPLSAFASLYLMYFHEQSVQVIFSVLYALVYGFGFVLIRRIEQIQGIAEHYLNVMLIFIACIPPILLYEQWSVLGWAIEGAILYLWALSRQSWGRLYLAQIFLAFAGALALYYGMSLDVWPEVVFAVLGLIYLAVVMVDQWRSSQRTLQNAWSIAFICMMAVYATLSLVAFFHQKISDVSIQFILSAALMTAVWFILNELMLRRQVDEAWILVKSCAISSLLIIDLIFLFNHINEFGWSWQGHERWILMIAALLQAVLWLRPQIDVQIHKEWMSFGLLMSLAMASLCLWSGMPYISMMILPVAYGFWVMRQHQERGAELILSKVGLMLVGVWILISPLAADSAELFYLYLMPLLNPFDLITVLVLGIFLWMLYYQDKTSNERGLWAFLSVASVLWGLSHITLRALHQFIETPYQGVDIWQNGTVQLSLTTLWVALAWVIMWLATLKRQRTLWILGSSILVVVTLKLVLFDLAQIGTLTRVISFLLAGGVMLLIAYLAPMPEKAE